MSDFTFDKDAYRNSNINRDLEDAIYSKFKAAGCPGPESITHVIYHNNCRDGFAAAVAALIYCKDGSTTPPTLISADHGDPLPDIPNPSAANVAIVDFSFPRQQLLDLKAKVKGLVVLDHHESAKQALEDMDFAYFDMSRSGCALSWAYFNPGLSLPCVFRYIEDRDLWKWALTESKAINARIREISLNAEVYLDLLKNEFLGGTEAQMALLAQQGQVLLESLNRRVQSAVKRAWFGDVLGYRVPMVITEPELASEVGNNLASLHRRSDFAAVGTYSNGELFWSLRSVNGFDVSSIAKKFSGGGHKAASGFKNPTQKKRWNIDPVAAEEAAGVS